MVIIGDVHGDWNGISFQIRKFNIKKTNFIQVGDFGIGFGRNDTDNLKTLNYWLVTSNCMLYVCRGNHDNPGFFDIDLWDRFSNVKFVPDYTVLTIEKKKVLFIGGGISIDRSQRIENRDYWKGEGVVFDLEKIKEIAQGINVIISHSAPQTFPPTVIGQIVYNWALKDPNILDDVRMERIKFQEICDEIIKLNPKKRIKWVYGHFHHSKNSVYKNIASRLLDCNEWFEIK